jgi:hypothetical protein
VSAAGGEWGAPLGRLQRDLGQLQLHRLCTSGGFIARSGRLCGQFGGAVLSVGRCCQLSGATDVLLTAISGPSTSISCSALWMRSSSFLMAPAPHGSLGRSCLTHSLSLSLSFVTRAHVGPPPHGESAVITVVAEARQHGRWAISHCARPRARPRWRLRRPHATHPPPTHRRHARTISACPCPTDMPACAWGGKQVERDRRAAAPLFPPCSKHLCCALLTHRPPCRRSCRGARRSARGSPPPRSAAARASPPADAGPRRGCPRCGVVTTTCGARRRRRQAVTRGIPHPAPLSHSPGARRHACARAGALGPVKLSAGAGKRQREAAAPPLEEDPLQRLARRQRPDAVEDVHRLGVNVDPAGPLGDRFALVVMGESFQQLGDRVQLLRRRRVPRDAQAVVVAVGVQVMCVVDPRRPRLARGQPHPGLLLSLESLLLRTFGLGGRLRCLLTSRSRP